MASKSGIDLASILASTVAWPIDRQALAAMFTVSVSIGNWQLAIGEWQMAHGACGKRHEEFRSKTDSSWSCKARAVQRVENSWKTQGA